MVMQAFAFVAELGLTSLSYSMTGIQTKRKFRNKKKENDNYHSFPLQPGWTSTNLLIFPSIEPSQQLADLSHAIKKSNPGRQFRSLHEFRTAYACSDYPILPTPLTESRASSKMGKYRKNNCVRYSRVPSRPAILLRVHNGSQATN